VNRLDTEDKTFGYIVDYKNLFDSVPDAINVYTSGWLDTKLHQEEDLSSFERPINWKEENADWTMLWRIRDDLRTYEEPGQLQLLSLFR
jgi:type I site-specific restriction-modification system R (restriction) subunit